MLRVDQASRFAPSEMVLLFCNEILRHVCKRKLHACLSANVVYRDATCNQIRGGVKWHLFSCLPASLVERLCWLRCDVRLDQADIGTRASRPRNSAGWHFPLP